MGGAAVLGLGVPLLSACGSDTAAGPQQAGIADGLAPEAGPLRIFNYADFINPELIEKFQDEHQVNIEITTFSTDTEAISKLANNSVQVDVHQATSATTLPRVVQGGLLQPLNRSYLPNFSNLLPAYTNPSYDPESRYTLPFSAFSVGIGYRTDRIDPTTVATQGWDLLWDPSLRGQVAVLDSYRTALGVAMLRRGVTDLNTGDPAILQQALDDLLALSDTNNVKVNISGYQDIPEGATTASMIWNGDMLGARAYLPENESPEVLGWWYPEDSRGIIGNDLMGITATAEHPVLAHLWLNFLLDPANARAQFITNGYQIPVTGFDPAQLAADGDIPPNLATAVYTEATADNGIRLTELSLEDDKRWEDAWSTFKSR